MNFKYDKLPSASDDITWYWNKCIDEKTKFSEVSIQDKMYDFTEQLDYFDLTDYKADKISLIGRDIDFFSQPIAMKDFEMYVFGEVNPDSQIGGLLANIQHLRPTAEVYGIYATYKYINKSVYCAFTICFVDKDTGMEMEAAVVEISQDEVAYIQPVFINIETLDYFTFDDLAKISYWLGNLWLGIQFELNNRPQEVRVVEQRGPIAGNTESGNAKKDNSIILVKRVIGIDEEGNEIKYGAMDSGRQYTLPAWGVRGHERTLADGRVIHVRPYTKGKERDNPDALVKKEYRFVDGNALLDKK